MQQSILAGGALLAATNAHANQSPSAYTFEDGKPFHLNYGIHDGMFHSHAGDNFIDQIKYAHSIGFRAIEDNGMMERTPEMQSKIGETLAKLNMTMGVFVITSNSWHWKTSLTTGKQEWIDLGAPEYPKPAQLAEIEQASARYDYQARMAALRYQTGALR